MRRGLRIMLEAAQHNVEIVHRLAEEAPGVPRPDSRFEHVVEIIEATMLALVAVATAWSGYQAARWDNHRARFYAEASQLLISAEELAVIGGQERIYDTTTFNAWLAAKSRGDQNLMRLFEQRFRPEYQTAFTVWMMAGPFENADAPPGPIFMPEYRNAKSEEAATLKKGASESLEQGSSAGIAGDQYVRVTVLLATVLLLTVISQRFRITSVRIGLLALAFLLMGALLWNLSTLPRI